MTKEQEELYRWFDEELSCNFNQLVTRMNKFFSQNVCIPKGENRHPYADVFHEAMEDTNKVIQFEDGHAGCDWTNLHLAKNRKHRIKPSEPVYEWQWVCQEHKDADFFVPIGWHTFEELQHSMYSLCKIEETKRIRQ